MYCKNCGREIAAGTQCAYCNSEVKAKIISPKQDETKKEGTMRKVSSLSGKKFEESITRGAIVAVIYLLLAFNYVIPALVLLAVVWFVDRRDDLWLKQNSIKPFAVFLLLMFVKGIIYLLPDMMSIIETFATIFGKTLQMKKFDDFISAVIKIVTLIAKIILLYLGAISFTEKTINIGVIDKLIKKCVH